MARTAMQDPTLVRRRVAPGSLSKQDLLRAMRWMLVSKAIDELAIKANRLNRLGVYGPVDGQEAAVIGSAIAFDPSRDWMVPASREQPAMLMHGLPLVNLWAGYMGRIDDARIPDDVRLLPRQQSIATQLPHAVGLAWALKLRREAAAVIVYCGDGATSEGDFHEAANLAGVQRVPLIFFVINNQYAISTPYKKQTGARAIAERAVGYGFPGQRVDGNDLFEVHAATAAAVERALDGGGPTLIEALCYRVGFHNTSDNPRVYRADAELEAARRDDPVERLRTHCRQAGFWPESREAEVRGEVEKEVLAAYEQVAALPRPGAEAVFEHVYATLPPRVIQQRQESVARR